MAAVAAVVAGAVVTDPIAPDALTRRAALKAAAAAFGATAIGLGKTARATSRPARLFVPGYRTAQAEEAGRLIVDLPGVSRAPAGWTGPRTLLTVVDLASPQTPPKRAAFPVRGHGVTLMPAAGVGIFAGMEGDTVVSFDLESLDLVALARPVRPGWVFGGHPVPLPDGRHVAVAERAPADPASGDTAADLARLSGRVVIRDAVSLAPIGDFSSYGLRPHDMQVTGDHRHLVIANYGSTVAADAVAGEPVIPHVLAPCVTIVELSSGRLVDRIAGADPAVELRHLVAPSLARIFGVTAKVTATGPGEDNGRDPAAEPGLDYAPALPLKVVGRQARALMADQADLARHGLSIAANPATDEILITFPARHLVAVFDGATGNTKKLIRTDRLGLYWPCGLALSPDGGSWHVTGYWEGIMTLRADNHALAGINTAPAWWGHSHVVVG
jgi:hypothetical protein